MVFLLVHIAHLVRRGARGVPCNEHVFGIQPDSRDWPNRNLFGNGFGLR